MNESNRLDVNADQPIRPAENPLGASEWMLTLWADGTRAQIAAALRRAAESIEWGEVETNWADDGRGNGGLMMHDRWEPGDPSEPARFP